MAHLVRIDRSRDPRPHRARTALVLAATVAMAAGRAAAQQWTPTYPRSQGAPMVYDLARSRCVLFTASDERLATSGTTWELAGAVWQRTGTPNVPPARNGHALAFDAIRMQVVLFGGVTGGTLGSGGVLANDTWTYDGRDWLPAGTTAAPSPRFGHAMACDAHRGRTVLFGGSIATIFGPGTYLGDTWEFDGTAWTSIQPTASPSRRVGHAMAFDLSRGRTVLFGGSGGATLADTWEYDGTNWNAVATATAPTGRAFHGLASDAARNRTVMFGGVSSGSSLASTDDTWEYDGVDWRRVQTTRSPQRRFSHAIAFDPARGRTVLFGGATNGLEYGDTWEYDGTTWQEHVTATAPPPRQAALMAYDTSRARLVLVGGFGPAGRSDTWEHDGTTWQLVQPMVSAPTVGQSAAVYDVFGRKVVCFDANGFTLEYDGATWRRLLPSASPPRLILHAMAYDAARRRVVLFGGGEPIGNIIWRNDTWEFDGTSWSQVPVTSPPQPRGFHGMAYDHARRRVILFGGDVQRAAMNDTWLYDGVAWAQAFPPTSPPPQDNNTLVYDAQRGRTILIGDSTWEFDGTTWSPIPPGVAPSLRYSTSAAYDMARGRVVLFGGQDVVDQLVTADTWELEPPRTPSWTAYGTGCAAGGVEPGLVVPAAIVPALGATVTFQLSALPPRAGAVLLEFGRDLLHCSGSALPVELPWLPPGCAGWIEPEPGFATLIVHGGNVASWSFTIPNRPVLAGLVIGQQGIVLDHPAPHGIHGLTNAGILRIF